MNTLQGFRYFTHAEPSSCTGFRGCTQSTSKFQHPASNIQLLTFNFQHSISNTQLPISNIQHLISNTQHPADILTAQVPPSRAPARKKESLLPHSPTSPKSPHRAHEVGAKGNDRCSDVLRSALLISSVLDHIFVQCKGTTKAYYIQC